MRAAVLSGGGVKGAFQIGVLRELLENDPNLDYDILAGISVGALNTSLLATGPLSEALPKLEDIWFNQVKGNHSVWRHHLWFYMLAGIITIALFIIMAFISFIVGWPKIVTIILALCALGSFYIPFYSLTHTHSFYYTDPLRERIESNLDLKKLRTSGKKLRIGAVSFTTGKYRSVTEQQENIIDWIMASSAFPVFFPMQHIENEYWTDGGVIDIAPLSEVIRMGATEIDIILCSPIDVGHYFGQPGIIKQMMRNIDIMSSEILRNDLEARSSIADGAKIRVFMPTIPLTSNALEFDPARIKRMYEVGRTVAKDMLEKY